MVPVARHFVRTWVYGAGPVSPLFFNLSRLPRENFWREKRGGPRQSPGKCQGLGLGGLVWGAKVKEAAQKNKKQEIWMRRGQNVGKSRQKTLSRRE